MFDNAPLKIRPPHLRRRVVPIAAGDSLAGWLAGPQVTVEVHWEAGASKPCRDAITKGKVLCDCLKEPRATRTIGYVPIITPEKEQFVIIVSATVAAAVAGFPFATPIEFHRSRKPKTPLRVKQSGDGRFNPTSNRLFTATTPRDIKPYLIHLWGDVLLAKHFGIEDDGAPICIRPNNPTTASETVLGAASAAREDVPGTPKQLGPNTRKKASSA